MRVGGGRGLKGGGEAVRGCRWGRGGFWSPLVMDAWPLGWLRMWWQAVVTVGAVKAVISQQE